MRIAFIHVGDELLTGQLDPYPGEMIRRVRERRAEVVLVSVVRDVLEEVVQAFRFAQALGPDIAVVTGGLGPTLDDLTREALAAHLGAELEVSEEAAGWMDEALERMHGAPPPRNEIRLRMARVPRGAAPLRNLTGAACGVEATRDGTTFFLLPGFPDEMLPMFEAYVLGRVAGDDRAELETVVWKGESTLEPLFREVAMRFAVRVASLPSAEWRRCGNRVVIKGPREEAERAMAFFRKEADKLGGELSCL